VSDACIDVYKGATPCNRASKRCNNVQQRVERCKGVQIRAISFSNEAEQHWERSTNTNFRPILHDSCPIPTGILRRHDRIHHQAVAMYQWHCVEIPR